MIKLIELTFVAFLSLALVMAPPCIWDSETLLMERSRFPSANELIVGKFRRHSKEFHLWRIKDRESKIKSHPQQVEYYDDLAVSYEKIGKTDKAIELMNQKAAISPGLYETHANLGTFYIHKGDYQAGLSEIEKAIAINPDAHFGREVYQKLLVEYLISRPEKAKENQTSQKPHGMNYYNPRDSFASFVLERQFAGQDNDHHMQRNEIEKALEGVLGMMRFGNFDSPVLLEALADLLMHEDNPPRRLAARALLQAARASEPDKAAAFERRAKEILYPQQTLTKGEFTVEMLQARLNRELDDANTWFNQIREDEKQWIAAGKDVEAEYAAKYYSDPGFINASPVSWLHSKVAIILATSIGLITVLYLFRRLKPKTSNNKD